MEYAKIHGCSPEQIKQYLREENRIKGGIQIGRDWVFPKDTYFPEDRRRKCQKNFIDLH
ncbi:MAG: DNA-binding protein [Clostridia bacterium]|nr:DNA-binding protein [Clostridia bacterium]